MCLCVSWLFLCDGLCARFVFDVFVWCEGYGAFGMCAFVCWCVVSVLCVNVCVWFVCVCGCALFEWKCLFGVCLELCCCALCCLLVVFLVICLVVCGCGDDEGCSIVLCRRASFLWCVCIVRLRRVFRARILVESLFCVPVVCAHMVFCIAVRLCVSVYCGAWYARIAMGLLSSTYDVQPCF